MAALLFGGAWWGTSAALQTAGLLNTPLGALLAGAVPAAPLLPVPLYLTAERRTSFRHARAVKA